MSTSTAPGFLYVWCEDCKRWSRRDFVFRVKWGDTAASQFVKKSENMTYKGSVVIKRTDLLNLIQNQRAIFRSNVDDECKWHAWGRQISYETLLEGGWSWYNWDAFMQSVIDMRPDSWVWCGFKWLYSGLSQNDENNQTVPLRRNAGVLYANIKENPLSDNSRGMWIFSEFGGKGE